MPDSFSKAEVHAMTHSYLQQLVLMYRAHANPSRAVGMSAYMRNHFVFFGLPSPVRKAIDRDFLGQNGKPPLGDIPTIARAAYAVPQREVQYFMNDTISKIAGKLPEPFLDTAKFMVQTKSWWDTVDAIASNIIGPMALNHPEIRIKMNRWIADENLWMRRTAILYQLKYREKTDWEQLAGFCEQAKTSKAFFIRKAIGWALREYSKTNSESVVAFVGKTDLASLSKREALKWLEAKGRL